MVDTTLGLPIMGHGEPLRMPQDQTKTPDARREHIQGVRWGQGLKPLNPEDNSDMAIPRDNQSDCKRDPKRCQRGLLEPALV